MEDIVKVTGVDAAVREMNRFNSSLAGSFSKIKSFESQGSQLLKRSGLISGSVLNSAGKATGTSSLIGSMLGGEAGFRAGASVGSRIGMIAGPKGMAAGGLIGGIIGGAIGVVAGQAGASIFSGEKVSSPYAKSNSFFQGVSEESFYSPEGQTLSDAISSNSLDRLDFLDASLNDMTSRIYNYVRQ